MIIHINFKVDSEEDPDLARWLEGLKKKDRVKSFQIRQALKAYLKGKTTVLDSVIQSPLVIEPGEIFTNSMERKQEPNESEVLAKLDSMF